MTKRAYKNRVNVIADVKFKHKEKQFHTRFNDMR